MRRMRQFLALLIRQLLFIVYTYSKLRLNKRKKLVDQSENGFGEHVTGGLLWLLLRLTQAVGSMRQDDLDTGRTIRRRRRPVPDVRRLGRRRRRQGIRGGDGLAARSSAGRGQTRHDDRVGRGRVRRGLGTGVTSPEWSQLDGSR